MLKWIRTEAQIGAVWLTAALFLAFGKAAGLPRRPAALP